MAEEQNKLNEYAVLFMNRLREDGGDLSSEQIEALTYFNTFNTSTDLTDEQQKLKVVCSILQDQTQRAACT